MDNRSKFTLYNIKQNPEKIRNMKKILLISFLLALSIAIMAQNSTNYKSEWKVVEQYNEKSLPQSALKKVDEILQKAIKEKNNQQVIRALIEKNKYKIEIDDKDNQAIFTDLQGLLSQTADVSEKALLSSMIAELYMNYLSNDSWIIRQRTALVDFVPSNMSEWTLNIFEDKIIDNLNSSVVNIYELKKHTTKEFEEIIVLGKDEQAYYPTLYDFLMKRAIETSQNLLNASSNYNINFTSLGVTDQQLVLPAGEYVNLKLNTSFSQSYRLFNYYQQFFKELIARNLTPTIILTELDKLNFISNYSNKIRTNQQSILENLYRKYESSPASTEIVEAIVNGSQSNKEKYEWCEKGIKKYPDYDRVNILKSSLVYIEQQVLEMSGSGLFSPDSTVAVNMAYKNLQSLGKPIELKLYSLNLADKGTYLKSFNLSLSSKNTYETDTAKYDFGKLQPGHYRLSYKEDAKNGDTRNYEFYVTRFGAYSRTISGNSSEIYVVDNITGKPIDDASIKVYPYQLINKQWDYSSTPIILKTDKSGKAIFKLPTNIANSKDYRYTFGRFTLSKRDDKDFGYLTLNKDYRYNYISSPKEPAAPTKITNIFIDRSIYRPGQTVYYKAVLTVGDSLRCNELVTAKLLNANREVIGEKQLRTDDFGSVAGEFVIPQSGLNGNYNIQVDYSTTGFNVEEYKRPTFEIIFDKLEGTYSLGENVTVKGYVKNFSGVSLQNTDVNYTISRNQFSFWRYDNPTNIEDGVVKTNNDGTFEISFIPKASDNYSNFRYPIMRDGADDESINQIYTFTIQATVTDLNGETQSNSFSTLIGNVSMIINVDIPQKIEKTDKSIITIEALNLNQQKISTSGTYTIYSLDSKNKNQAEVTKGSFSETGIQTQIRDNINKLKSGKYRITVEALDDNKKTVKSNATFILYSFDDRKPPIEGNDWIVVKNDTIAKGRNGEIIYGVTDKDIYVLYQVYDNTKVYDQQLVKLSDENRKFIIPFKDEYKDQVNVTFTFVRNNEFTSKNIVLQKAQPSIESPNLDVKLAVFRDKLRPGEEENWTISVTDKTGDPVSAELLASMYDTSIDKLRPTVNWTFRKEQKYAEYQYPFNYNYLNNNLSLYEYCNIYFPINNKWTVKPLEFDRVNWFGYLSYFVKGGYALRKSENYVLSESSVSADYAVSPSPELKATIKFTPPAIAQDSVVREETEINQSTPSVSSGNAPQIRQNFNETAFFYPQLRTNEKGEVSISFKVPDSNTTWKFRALAYDRKLQTGSLEQLVVSKKELMITPNMPRFVRVGDKTSISTKISNLTDHDMSGDVKIEFFDPATDKLIDLNIPNQEQSFYTESESSSQATWTFTVPANMDMIGCRIIAKNSSFSDGEQHVLVVLPNRMLVTESMAFEPVKGAPNTFTFESLYNSKSTTLDNYRLTLEFAGNPAWYAIQALPVLSNPTNENAVNWFASYYSNSLGASIMKLYPRVSTLIANWKKQSGDKAGLVSKLQTNQELRTILLQETPWVLEAKDETEQMRRLSLLFDINNNSQLTKTAFNKLKQLQTDEGGWAWYKGMSTSRSITQYILYGFAELQLTGKIEYDEKVKMMQIEGLQYIDRQILKDYTDLQKNDKDWKRLNSIYNSQLEYLYVRSFYRDIPIDVKTREAERFYTGVASNNWKNLDLYQRSLLAVILYRNGDKAQSVNLTNSIREHAIVNKKLEMYWPNNRSSAFMSMSAVSVHTFIMDALKETGATDQEMDCMKRWLIAQKRTQQWGSTHATIDAINAILSSGNDWFSVDVQCPLITIGDTTLDANKIGEMGTGYFTTSWNRSEIKNDLGKVVVSQVGDQPSYGSLYWQYYQDLDKINKAEGDKSTLQIDKQLFKEEEINSVKSLVPITEKNFLRVGDKVVVRLVINAGQDMNFVQLKDMRASCFEPLDVISGLRWKDKIGYYQTTEDASTNFFFDFMPKGTYVLEYSVYVTRTGSYANGITTIQCAYAPEYISHTGGIKVNVKK